MTKIFVRILLIFSLLSILILDYAFSFQKPNIFDAVFPDKDEVPQISTNEFIKMQKEGAIIIDNRPYIEWSISNIPGSMVVSPKPGTSKALYTSDAEEIEKVVKGDKKKLVILYCDGIYCGKSRRVAKDLIKRGFTNVYRYQLGIPIWRALGNVTKCEIEGIKYIYNLDKTAYFIDARKNEEFSKFNLKNSKNIPFDKVTEGKDTGEILKAKEDGRLPVDDRNTRIIVYGNNKNEALKVAEALVKEAFHNVCFYDGEITQIIKLSE